MSFFDIELEKSISEEVQLHAEKEYASQLVTSMLSKDASSHASISVDSMSLFESNITFAHYMFQNPRRALKLLDDAFQKVSLRISTTHILKADMMYKENLHVRLIALPNLPEVYRSNLPHCSDVGQFLCINGTVVKTSTAKMLQYKKLWRCSKCKYQFIVEAEVEQGYICEKPVTCSNPEFCNGKSFTLMSADINTEWCKDYQEIKLQEQVYSLSVGTVPRSMWVILEDDLVETCHPGNDVIVSGILIQQWKPLFRSSSITIDLVLFAHNIEVQNKMSSGVVSKDMVQEFKQFWYKYKLDPLSGRNFILSSICSQVFGLYIVKLAVALVLAGGVQKKSCSSRIRGDSHLLLIGDPGTAKSQFLKFVTKVSSRSVLTSGIGTTNAGLTVSAVKESGRWELEAGALVLADGGICCIDEFSCIKEQDKTCIHEAMEQQTISVAKAGLVCSLNTRCSILAATNPKGKYDETLSLSENTALGSPLLSRFDIILVLLDTYDENWDDMVASYILDGRNIATESNAALWPIAKIKNYFTLIRHINPKVTSDAERVLQLYYTKQRSLQSRSTSRTTPRLLQSLIRLAEGHARLMFRTKVLVIDAIIAIILIESSMLGNSILEGLSPLHTVFPNNPTAEYAEKAEMVFQNLNIQAPIEENYTCFYEECSLTNLLHDISSVWSSKDAPYIFGTSLCDISSNQESDLDNCEIITRESNFEESEDLFHKPTKNSSYQNSQNALPVQQYVVAEMCEKTFSSEIHPTELNNQVTSLSDLQNVFCDSISETETCKTKNTENPFVLHQILVESDIDIVPQQSNLNLKSNFNNAVESDGAAVLNIRQTYIESNEASTKKITKLNFERSNLDVLKELGISPEEELINNEVNLPSTSAENSSFVTDKLFPPKKSLADQLKNFAFSKTHLNSQHNFLNTKRSSDDNKNSLTPETTSLLSTKNTKEKEILKNNLIHEKHKAVNQSENKKSVFKMIVNKCKSSQNNTENISGNFSTSDVLQNSQSHKNDQISNVSDENVAATSKSTENYCHFEAGDSSRNSLKAKKSLPTLVKKPVPEKLKMFAFSKRKNSKS